MSYFFYVHQEDAEVTIKVVLPSTPVSIRYIMDKVMADPASSSIRTSSWIVSLDGSKPIVNEQDLLKIGPNSDVFLLPKPKEPSAEDAAVAAPDHSAGGKALEVYFHVFNTEEDDDPMITTRRPFDPTWERDAVLASILTASAAQSLKRGGSDVTVKYLAQKGQPLTIWASGEKLSTYPVNGDVMIFGNKPKVVAQRPPSATTSASTASTSPAVPPPSAANDESRRASMELRAKCDELESQRKFAAVAALLNEAIAAAPSDEGKRLMRSELARMWLERAKVPERALPVLDSLIQEVEDKIPVEHVKLLIAKGHAHFDQKKWKAASDAFSRACSEAETHGIKLPLDIAKDVRLYLGASFFAQGYDEGIKIIQETLEGDVNNTFGVMWMSKAYAAKGHPEDALQWAVQLVVRDQKNEELKANFAEICSKVPKPVQIIKTKVLNASPGADRAMAWGFLGQVARDHGQLALSRDLYQEALNLKPTSANIALNHAHVFEQMGNSLECLKHLCMFINRNSNQSMNGTAQASKILPLVQDGLRAALTGERKMHTELLRLTEDEEILVLEPTEENKAIKPGHSNGWDPNSSSRELGLVGERLFTEEELSLAGIYFTVVKVLYTMGCLHKIPPIVKIIEEARRNEKMSRTNMKNEHAYYTTICESMQWLNHERENPDELLAKSADVRSQLFVCGDSHSLPLSWQKLTLDGAEVVTVNKLVTGLKIWHLRDECTFFPRFNFDAVAMSIPEGADVLFCFGEIDCREGILRAVEKGVYDNHKDAMVKLMEIYVTRLMKLRKERKLRRVFVHAAFPILDLTRHVVCAFNQVFTAVFNHVPGFHCINNTDDILTLPTSESGQPSELAKASGELRVVKPQFTLDHTHINPQYVKELLEGSLNASVRSKPAVEFA